MSIVAKTKTSVRFQHMMNGKRYSKSMKTFGMTKAEINKAHADWICELETGRIVRKAYTVREYSALWLKVHKEPKCRPKVLKNCKHILKNHILPKFGKKKLETITPLMINNYILELKSTKSLAEPDKNISIGTIKKIYAIFKDLVNCAYKDDLIVSNPFSKVTLSFSDMEKHTEINCWNQFEYKQALALLRNETSDNKYIVEFALKTGLRLSEIFGLDWEDIDFAAKTINVTKSRQKDEGKMIVQPTKTGSSRRKISMPQSVADMLLEYRKNHFDNEYVFSNLDYDASTAWYRKWLRSTSLPYIRFHDLRHTHASLLLLQGVDIKTISERLGHSDIYITMNVYTHVMKDLDQKASEAIDAI